MKMYPLLLLIALTAFGWVACTSDDEETLFGKKDDCDTANVSYKVHLAPVMAQSCNTCHSASFPTGGVKTSDYSGLAVIAANGKLKGAVSHQAGFSPMPQGQPKLDTCTLKRIEAWINKGFPDN